MEVAVTQSGDFASVDTRIVVIDDSGSATVHVATVDDGVNEADGSVTATVKPGGGYTVGGHRVGDYIVGDPSSATVGVADDDAATPANPDVTIAAGADVTEGTAASFTVTAAPAPEAALAVTVTVAQSGEYTAGAGSRTVTVPATGSVTFTVATTDDEVDEADGSVTATVAAGDGYTVGDASSATVAVADDDVPPPTPEVTISAGADVTEGAAASFTVTAAPAPEAALAVTVTVAQSGDYTAGAGSRTVTVPTTGSVTFTVATTDDDVDEADGSVTATVNTGDGYTVGDPGSATVAVADDDDPPVPVTVTLASAAASVSEDDGETTFTITLSRALGAGEQVTVPFTVSGGDPHTHWNIEFRSADNGAGVVRTAWGSNSAVRFSSGGRVATLTFIGRAEPATADRPITVAFGTGARAPSAVGVPGGIELGAGTFTIDVTNNDPTPANPEVTITAGAGVTEGTAASFTLTAAPKPSAPKSVTVAITQSGSYTTATGSRTVTVPTTGSVTFTVATTDDSTHEPDGSITATVDTGSGYSVGAAASATVEVADNDAVVPEITVTAGGDVTEGDRTSFTLTAAPAPNVPVTVSVTFTETGDFTYYDDSKSLTVRVSAATTVVRGDTIDDRIDEPHGTVTLTVDAGDGYTVGAAASATVAVADNDDPPPEGTPVINVASAGDITEGRYAYFTITATPVPDYPLALNYVWSETGDMVGFEGSDPFKGPLFTKVGIGTINDDVDEADGTVTLTLKPGSGYIVGPSATATVAVADNDDADTVGVVLGVSAAAASIAENNGVTDVTLTLNRALEAGESVTVPLIVTGGEVDTHWNLEVPRQSGVTLTDPGAKIHLSKSETGFKYEVRLSSGATAGKLKLYARPNTDNEDRTITVAISMRRPWFQPYESGIDGGLTLGATSVEVDIINDDAPPPTPSVTITAGPGVTEGGAATFTLTAKPAPLQPMTVKVSVTQNGAYATSTGARTVTITSTGTATVTVATTDDITDEPDGSITATVVSLSDSDYEIGTPSAAVVAVADNDVADPTKPVTLAVSDAAAAEGDDLVFTVSLNRPSTETVTVYYVTADWTADTTDYTFTNDLIEIEPGQTQTTIRIPTRTDNKQEGTEKMVLELVHIEGAQPHNNSGTGHITDN
ncbi:MAG: hypothetical protein F4Z89_00655 [Acidimicrobiaceae bacterium]|nr:hypothetical protein [Acidimicrobiaceae bacterium]